VSLTYWLRALLKMTKQLALKSLGTSFEVEMALARFLTQLRAQRPYSPSGHHKEPKRF